MKTAENDAKFCRNTELYPNICAGERLLFKKLAPGAGTLNENLLA